MAGDAETGVTIHRTTAELDAGPVAAQRAFPIGPEDDAGVVYERAAALAVELLDEVLPEPAFEPQPEDGRDVRGEDRPGRPRARLDAAGGGARQPDPRALAAHRRPRRASTGRPVIVVARRGSSTASSSCSRCSRRAAAHDARRVPPRAA